MVLFVIDDDVVTTMEYSKVVPETNNPNQHIFFSFISIYRLATEKDEEMKLNAVPSRSAPGGTRYLDIESVDDSSLALAKAGDVATIHYKVLKLGKRSFDGQFIL